MPCLYQIHRNSGMQRKTRVSIVYAALFTRNSTQSAPVAVAIIFCTKSNYDQFGFARIRTNIKRFALKFGARCMGCVPISPVEHFVCSFETMSSPHVFIIIFVVSSFVYDHFVSSVFEF